MNMLRHPFQNTIGYRIFEVFASEQAKSLCTFAGYLFALAIISDILMPSVTNAASVNLGWDMNAGTLSATDFTKSNPSQFSKNIGKAFTAVRVIGNVVVAAGIVFTAIRYRAEDQAQRAQEMLIRGGVALLIVNLLPSILRFVIGAFEGTGIN